MYHIRVRYADWSDKEILLPFRQDTTITISLNAHEHFAEEISIIDSRDSLAVIHESGLTYTRLSTLPNASIADQLNQLPGADILRTGANIGKPVIEGLFGSRLAIIHAGTPVSNQSWGLDHAPEIDPMNLEGLRIVTGPSAIKYQAPQLSGLVIADGIEPSYDIHLHGRAKTFYASNGQAYGGNLILTNGGDSYGFSGGGSYRRSGDMSAPDYYLRNTGSSEYSAFLNGEYESTSLGLFSLKSSLYSRQSGVLRGAHVSTLNDLERAIGRDEPFYTKKEHSYDISNPFQDVSHYSLSLTNSFDFPNAGILNSRFSVQINDRKEFDLRRGGRSSKASLSMLKRTLYGELTYLWNDSGQTPFEIGAQATSTENLNDPETGILPLIPDFVENTIGLYGFWRERKGDWNFEAAIRSDYKYQDAAFISRGFVKEIIDYWRDYTLYAASVGVGYDFTEHSIGLAIKSANRNPDISELFSSGLHQGTGGIEYGDPNLDSERLLSIKTQAEGKFSNLFYDLHIGISRFWNFIFIAPTGETETTIRGTFPVFRYSTVDALITTADLELRYELTEDTHISGGASYIEGRQIDGPFTHLVYMPQNNISFSADQHLHQIYGIDDIDMRLAYIYYFRQDNIDIQQDILPPPPAFGLFSASIRAKEYIAGKVLTIGLRADNLLNTSYRQYMDRLRYFADSPGINISLDIGLEF